MKINIKNKGFSVIELIIALAIFAILATGVFYVATNSYKNFYGVGDRQTVTEFADEGIEIVRAIRNNSWQTIETVSGDGAKGLAKNVSGYWEFSGTSDTSGDLTRIVTITNAQRDASWDITDSGTEDPNTKKVVVTVSGTGIDNYVLTTYVTNWSYKTWEQSDWSGVGDREFWSDLTMASSSYSNISTTTVGELALSQLAGSETSWADWADLIPDSRAAYKAWEDFYNYELGADGRSLYLIGTTNFDFIKYDISRAAAGIFRPEWKRAVPWHTQNVAFHPDGDYAYINKRLPADGTDNVCVVDLTVLTAISGSGATCYDITYPGGTYYAMDMVVNAAGDALYMFDSYGYGYAFEITGGGATLTVTNAAQLISAGSGSGYAINKVYLDESGAEPYIYIVGDDYLGEFKKMGINDNRWFSSTSTNAYVHATYVSDITDMEFLEQSSGKNRFVLGNEGSTEEFIIVEDQGTSLSEIGSYNVGTSQGYAEVIPDVDEDMAFIHYYNPGGIYAIDITNRASPADGVLSNPGFGRKSNYTTFDQSIYSTTSRGFFVGGHDGTTNTTTLYFIGKTRTNPTGGTFDYKRTITLGENGNVSGGAHVDFPVVISETNDYFKTTGNGGNVYNEYGYDVIFTSDSDGTLVLDHEIEYYASTTGEYVAWVKVDSLAADTDIYMFYGNSNVTSTTEHIDEVWSSNYKMVTHMTDSGIGGVGSSVNSSNGWFKYDIDSPSESSGRVGRAQYFDGDYDYLTVENNSDKAQGTDDFTVEFWMKPDSAQDQTYSSTLWFGNGDVNDADAWLFRTYLSTKKLYFHMGHNNVTNLGGMYVDTAAITDDVWSYIATTVDRDVGYQAYINTVIKSGCTASPCDDTTAYDIGNVYDVNIGKDWSSKAYFFHGEIDEVRISSDVKSTDWMTTGYNNINSTTTFYTIGAETQMGYNTPGSLYSSILDLGSTDKEIKSLTVEQNVPAGCDLQITAEVSDDVTFATGVTSEVYSDASAGYYTSSTDATMNGKRYLRYKAALTACSSNANTPTLYGARFNYR
jgi:prepilin-type N-terminal cleavage/methylation domain-containing protein